MNVIENVFSNLNTYLVLFLAGLAVWIIRQAMPDHVEGTKVWRVVLRILPILLGGLIAIIPGLRPMPENLQQSIAIGLIAGSFATSTYELLRELVSKKLKAALGSRAKRIKIIS